MGVMSGDYADEGNGKLLKFRVDQHDRKLSSLDNDVRSLDKTVIRNTERIDDLGEGYVRIEKKVDGTNTRLNILISAWLSGCLGLALTVLAGTGKI